MAKIQLTGTFPILPEGEYILKITNVLYNEVKDVVTVYFITQDNRPHKEPYYFKNREGKTNDAGINNFSKMVHDALQDYNITSIEHDEIIGRYLHCTIVHKEYPDRYNNIQTSATIKEHSPANGFDDTSSTENNYDLDNLL